MKAKTILLYIAVLLAGCTNEAYDSGDGKYSDLRADFVEAAADGSGAFISFITDDGESLSLTQAIKPSWAEKGDTTYRALIYYNPVVAADGSMQAEPVMLRMVYVPEIWKPSEIKNALKTDPVVLNSAWISRSGRYLNLDLSLKTGQSDDTNAYQTLGLVLDSMVQDGSGRTTAAITLHHDQGSVPEYYSSSCFVSVPLLRAPLNLAAGDTVVMNVQTYSGLATRTFVLEDRK